MSTLFAVGVLPNLLESFTFRPCMTTMCWPSCLARTAGRSYAHAASSRELVVFSTPCWPSEIT
ncbi:hypothetical protein PF005_g33166 [Phytophthora fragariae]|uniref:Uncharacterized protein n=1 Tax=Phytophthora fragariae TaxID=53985 RepID=A0A6A3PAJ8_9STRA|nr:hypothetical protein PF007_g32634 [Phytophthora fragariae]KAE9054998.1 hypothetical protein PF006_g33103 [Phytophthora fragariae]KAE9156559.1 hypothetical protein PF005_g33166 [Phytophthora fragariae]KAE9157078.1 hypothetical protein PF002_g33456 [Phytophthora fragariae]